jgi:hypothetical protein
MLGVPAPTSHFEVCTSDANAIYLAKRLWYSAGVDSEMWVTFNEGDTWSNVTEGLPANLYFTYIAVDDDDPQIAWVTCSGFENDMKIFKTENGGSTWENISLNLPNIPINCVILDEKSTNHTLYIGTDLGVYTISDELSEWEPFLQNLPNVIVGELEINYESSEMYAATFGRGIWKTTIPETTVSVSDSELPIEMTLYPNPVVDKVQIELALLAGAVVHVRLVDIHGREVLVESFDGEEGTNRYEVDSSSLSSGAYFMEVKVGNATKVQKVVKL